MESACQRPILLDMAINKTASGSWQVRTYDADRKPVKKNFATKKEARAFEESLRTDVRRGTYVDPRLGQEAFGTVTDRWLATWLGHLRPSTRARYEGLVRKHIRPRWDDVPVATIKRPQIQAWVSSIQASSSTQRQALQAFRLILDQATDEGLIPVSPAQRIKIEKTEQRSGRYLDAATIGKLADLIGVEVLVLGFGGLRFGELAALRVADLDVERQRLRVRRSVTEVAGRLTEGPTKGHAMRWVPLPAFVFSALLGAVQGRSGAEYVFGSPGPLRVTNWSARVWKPACAQLGLDGVRVHDLRHSCASLAIGAGASIKGVQMLLGHASGQLTIDTYGHLTEGELERVADALGTRYALDMPSGDHQAVELTR